MSVEGDGGGGAAMVFTTDRRRGLRRLLPGRAERTALFASASTSQARAKAASEEGQRRKGASDQRPLLLDVVAGAAARAGSQATIHPIDTLKVRMQAGDMKREGAASRVRGARPSACRGFVVASASTSVSGRWQVAVDDVKSLYRGVGGAASAAGMIIGAYFAFYSTTKRALQTHTDLPTGSVAFISGSVAAVGSGTVKVPLAVCIRSVQAGVYSSAREAATQITQKAGWKGLFTGFMPTLLEDVPDMAVKFACYETLRPLHTSLCGGRQPNTAEDLLMGGIAGASSAAVTTPLDVVKTRMMCSASRQPTVISAFRDTIRTEQGAMALFRGIGPRCVSNGLNSAIFFCFFEAIRSFISRTKTQQAVQQAYDESLEEQQKRKA